MNEHQGRLVVPQRNTALDICVLLFQHLLSSWGDTASTTISQNRGNNHQVWDVRQHHLSVDSYGNTQVHRWFPTESIQCRSAFPQVLSPKHEYDYVFGISGPTN